MNENTRQGRTDIWSTIIAGLLVSVIVLIVFRDTIRVWLI